jgi:ferric-dicitrate binding protein FerR (iron transport regulator)
MISLALALTLLSGAQSSDSLFSNVVVRARETVSWIAIRHLGAYDQPIRDTLKLDNPSVPDLDKVAVGQTLRLRRSMDRRPLPPERQIAMASRQAVVTTVKGTGEIRLKSGQLVPLAANTFLAAGDEIRLGAGSVAELVIDNQSILRLREHSRLRLLDIQGPTAEKGRKAGTRVALDQGALWVKVRKWAGPLVGFQVRLPSTIAGVHGTIFETTVGSDSTQTVSVREGEVSVTELRPGGRELRLRAGQKVVATAAGVLGNPSTETPAPQGTQGGLIEKLEQEMDNSDLEDRSWLETIRRMQESAPKQSPTPIQCCPRPPDNDT